LSLKKYGIITLAIMVLIIIIALIAVIWVSTSGYAHQDVFWLGPIGSFVIALYAALFVGFIVSLIIFCIIAFLDYRQTKKKQKLENKVVSSSEYCSSSS